MRDLVGERVHFDPGDLTFELLTVRTRVQCWLLVDEVLFVRVRRDALLTLHDFMRDAANPRRNPWALNPTANE